LYAYVYLLQSAARPEQTYIGVTNDVERRLNEHNSGQSIHTNKFKPWKLVVHVAFSDHEKADAFEQYLKTGSGRAFAGKRFW
jgi:predicted GIY-YIG superfamily endonuclease